MLNCLTYIAFVYWAVATVHTILPIDVGVCGADPSRGGLGALLHHTFGGKVDIDASVWAGFPCSGGLLSKLAFILRRPGPTVRHIMSGGGQDEPFVPILFLVPIIFFALLGLRTAGLRLISHTACRTFLKFGVAVGCRSMIILQSLAHPDKQSLYFKRYSKVEFFIVGYTAYVIELPVAHEALVSGGTLATILLMCVLFPGHFLPEVNPWSVALQGIAATALGIAHASYQQRSRARQRAALAARAAQRSTGKTRAADGTDTDDASCSKASAACSGAAEASPAAADATAAGTTRVGAAASTPAALAAVRRMQALRRRPYVSPARPCRISIKVQSAHLADLPEDLLSLVNNQMLAGSGWMAVGAYAREGCIELVLDLRPIAPTRVPYGGGADDDADADDRQAVSDQDPPGLPLNLSMDDPQTLRALGNALVSFMHSTGLIQPEQEPSVMLQLDAEAAVMTWQREQQTWVPAGDAVAAATALAAAAAAAVPSLDSASPVVAVSPPPGAPLSLRVVLRGPSVEEVLAGVGLVARHRSRPLPYSVVSVARAEEMDAASRTAVAGAAQPLLHVELAVFGVPPSGLLRLEARTASGLLSRPLAVLVDTDQELVVGLTALTASLEGGSRQAFLLDFGAWLDACAAAADAASHSAARTGDGGKASAAGGMVRVGSGAPLSGPTASASMDLANADVTCLDLTPGLARRDQARVPGAPPAEPAPTPTRECMLEIAAHLLAAVCQHSATDPAIGAVANRLIAMVIASAAADGDGDGTSPAAALAALLAAVPAPPTNAGPMHLAVASGSRSVAEVLLAWHQRVALSCGEAASAATVAALTDPWVSRAACGTTPLHIAAALPDGGAMATWALVHYPAAAAAWRTALTDDGLTPAALAARVGGRWRLRLWQGNPAVLAARRALAPAAPLGRAAELLWGFRDPSRERRYVATTSGQALLTLVLYGATSAMLPLLSLSKAALAGSCRHAALAALALHVPYVAPLIAWLARPAAEHAAAAPLTPKRPAAPKPAPPSRRGSAAMPLSGGGRLRAALLVAQVCRAATKAAVGLAVWPAPAPLPRGAALFLARGGDLALEAVARPLLEQVGLPARLLVSLVDAPAQLLLYRGLGAQQPGSFPNPLGRLLAYQALLLATTAAVAATSRFRFLRSEGGRTACSAPTAAAAAAPGASGGGLSQAPPGGGKAAVQLGAGGVTGCMPVGGGGSSAAASLVTARLGS